MLDRFIPLRASSALFLAIMPAGCATFGAAHTAALVSTDAAQVSAPAAEIIAEDLVGRLAEAVGPGTGTITLRPDTSAFAIALDTSLRKWGYAVAAGDKAEIANPIPLTYILDTLDDSVLARLSTPVVDLGRAYALTAAGAEPSSPLSVMLRS
ncbi:conjugal transfer protein TrbH (plasmid) [Devosia neptuniae]|uniref:Conjugal transfer protein TrbH n=1 Tax=Devosia neptuniae TaxID=191302 RepID=A0ABY6CA12_9HYPH|nr:conjugal transfer protein TrbH [Devosia neptuniae]UXN67917.1 conjugal transfer protein TrbH [Devosia neptuniae]